MRSIALIALSILLALSAVVCAAVAAGMVFGVVGVLVVVAASCGYGAVLVDGMVP